MFPEGTQFTWAQFREAFKAHHIPAVVIRRKLTEFLALKQGNNSVIQYAQAFNTLSQYAGYHVDTDEKKQACFRQGLSSKLQDRLAMIKFDAFSELVNGAIIQEDAHLAHKAEKKRKAPAGDLLAVLLRGSVWCSRAHSEPFFSTSHSSSGAIGHLSTHRHRGLSDLLFLSRLSRKSGCRSRGRVPICIHATTVGRSVTLHVTVRCRPSMASSQVNRTRRAR